jgi:hypothetical protein
MLEKERRAAA